MDLALLAGQVAWDERFTSFPFDRKEGEPEVRSYHLPFETVHPMTGGLAAAYEATLDFIAQKFQHWKRASHWQQHNPEIAEALFKPEQRERVFAGLLAEPELRYERHLTTFYQDLSEEPEEYEGRGEETERPGDNWSDYKLQFQRRNKMNLDPQKVSQIVVLMQQYSPGWNFSDPYFLKDEIEYKQAAVLKANELLSEVELKRLIEESKFEDFISRLDKLGKNTNLLFQGVPKSGDLNILYQADLDKPTFCKAVFDLLYGSDSSPDRLDRYISYVQANQLPNKWTFPTYFLFICHPDTEIFVKPQITQWFLEFFGLQSVYTSKPTGSAYTIIKQAAHQLKDELREYGPRDMVDIQSVIWVCANISKDIHFWKIAPGENAWNWDTCREGNFIAIGWDTVGNVANIKREEFDKRLTELQWTGKGAEQVWKFAHINEGDRIIVNRGTREVLGVGTVIGPYYFVPDTRHGHRLPIRWDDLTPRRIEEPSWVKTLIPLDREKFEAICKAPPINSNPIYPLPQLAEDTGFDKAELERWVRAIERKGQAILYGPPGTGKTFMAERLAAHLVGGGDGFWELVQFHPAYAYEDFIQGIRPQSEGDHLSYPVVPGRFLEFCREAGQRQGRCVLIIDEINRANLSRVLGELMYLLEYRAQKIPLAGGGSFQIPANVRLIGTMNTADRSIALVDHALRRRFAFLALYPNYELLRRYHRREQTGFPVEGLIDALTGLNRQIGDRHYEVGVTFFLHKNLAEQIEDIWRMEIEPYLEEYFFDRPGSVESFRWDKIKSRIL